jgi:hypothetical protein
VSFNVLLKLAQRGKFTQALQDLVAKGVALGLYTQDQLNQLKQVQAEASA